MKQDLADTLAELNKVAARVGLTKHIAAIDV
jgi:hypothetical protein